MKRFHLSLAVFFGMFLLIACQSNHSKTIGTLSSPEKNITASLFLTDDGQPGYLVKYKNTTVIDSSLFAFDFKDAKPMKSGFMAKDVAFSNYSERWEMPWGEKREVKNEYNEMLVQLAEDTIEGRMMNIHFKVFDDGVGFRFEFPQQKGKDDLTILDEHTQFKLAGDHTTWWIPGDWDIYEHLYNTSRFSEIDALSKRGHESLAQTHIPENAVNTPVTMRTDEGLHISFHEANLTDYAGMTLKIDTENLLMESELVGSDRLGYKVKRQLPFATPWRTIQISESAGGLIESDLIVNLNEPNKLGDIPWFTPMKYVGIWWDMHLGTKTWDYASGNHGATTQYAKDLIDFASENGLRGILVEGWNTGWEHWIGFEDREGVFDFVTPYPDYDLKEVVRYGKEKGVDLIMHHETSAAVRTYDQQLDTAFKLMQSLGIHAVKTGYVGKIIPKGEYHHGQWMVNHYRKVLETAAQYNIAVNAHEPIKATGIRRTYPNAIAREGLRGQEFNAWSADGGNPPEHLPIVAFTRMLAGPIDFTPGIFNLTLKPHKENNQINTTLAHQLALYVVINSPVQMVPDLTQYYEGHPAFQFIRDVPVIWEQSKVLNGEIGDFVTIARRERGSNNWFIGSITDENPRNFSIKLDFLDSEKKYQAIVYKDGKTAHWANNPGAYDIEEKVIGSASTIELSLAPGGGAAISLMEIK
ncbi:MAG: glycoside hydrolase family 97 protein [Bacteroidales bacterium]|nr:glycoside hydrolase family 97 protein [Bacteroidales bacterium]